MKNSITEMLSSPIILDHRPNHKDGWATYLPTTGPPCSIHFNHAKKEASNVQIF